MNSSSRLEGTWEQVKTHEDELKGKWVSVTIETKRPKSVPSKMRPNSVQGLKALGMLADMPEGSIEFAARKAGEKTLE